MPGPDPFDLVMRLSEAPLAPLVDALRRVHRGAAPATDLLAGLSPAPESSVGASRPPLPVRVAPSASGYDDARRHFVRHSERLREQALLTERLLDRFTAAPDAASLQQELRILCRPGGMSGARFVLVNSLDRTVTVTFRPGRPHDHEDDPLPPVRISFDPAHPRIARDEELEIRVTIEVPASIHRSHVEMGVDILGDDRLLMKLWLRIELRTGGGQ